MNTEEKQREYRRTIAQNELDLALLTTDSVWGKPEVPPELQDKLKKYYQTKDKDGTIRQSFESIWARMGVYTRDMRLANLSVNDGQYEYVKYFIDLAMDLFNEEYISAGIIALSRAATELELSQSKRGFLRGKMNTIRQESITGEMEPPKRRLFGGRKENE